MFKHTRMFMATKTITVTKEAYEALASDKNPGESFSQALLRTHKKNGDISRFIGAWSDMEEDTANKLHKHIEEVRRRAGKHRRKELIEHLK